MFVYVTALKFIYYNIYLYLSFSIYLFFSKTNKMSIFFIMQTVEENYKWAVPLIVSNFITILLIFFLLKIVHNNK